MNNEPNVRIFDLRETVEIQSNDDAIPGDNPKKRRISVLFLIPVALLGFILPYYFITPYFHMDRVRRAALAGDTKQLESLIDFPRLRENVRAQAMASLTRDLLSQPNNAWSGLGMTLGSALSNNLIDNMYTPSGLIGMVNGLSPQGTTIPLLPDAPKLSGGFKSPTSFAITINQAVQSKIILEWDIYRWRLVGLTLDGSAPNTWTSTNGFER